MISRRAFALSAVALIVSFSASTARADSITITRPFPDPRRRDGSFSRVNGASNMRGETVVMEALLPDSDQWKPVPGYEPVVSDGGTFSWTSNAPRGTKIRARIGEETSNVVVVEG